MVGSYGFVVPDSCAGVFFYGSYGFVVPDSCAGVSFTVAMALSCLITERAYRLQ